MPRGRSAASAISESSDMDTDVAAEAELSKLQRQFRIMEGDRQAYSMQSQERIRKQRLEIEKLQQEQEELQRSLQVSQTRNQRDRWDVQQLRKLLNQQDQLDEQLKRERDEQTQIKQEIKALEKNLAELRKEEVSTANSHKSLTRQSQKISRTLENKLELTRVRFSEQLAKNRQLREELETLLEQRESFQRLKHRLEKELQKTHQEISDVISKSTAAFDMRVEAQSKIKMIKDKTVKDLTQYNAEVKEMERVIAHERSLKEFMKTKRNERSRQDTQDLSHRQEIKEELRMDSEQETFEDVFKNIQKMTDEKDLESFVTTFIQAEDKNFALFKYVNEQNNQVEAIKLQISQTKEEMKRCGMERQQQELEHQEALKKVKEQQREAEDQTLDYETQAREISTTLDQMKTGVSNLLKKIHFDETLVEDLLGSSSRIRNDNIITYLSLVEHKTNEMLTAQAFINSKDLNKDYDPKVAALLLHGQSEMPQKETDGIHPSLAGERYEAADWLITELDDRPLTVEELRLRVLSGVRFKVGGLPAERTQLSKLNTFPNRKDSPDL